MKSIDIISNFIIFLILVLKNNKNNKFLTLKLKTIEKTNAFDIIKRKMGGILCQNLLIDQNI